MSKWILRAGRLVDGGVKLADLSQLQRDRLPTYCDVLDTARQSRVPSAHHSNYPVRGSIAPVGQQALPAGNIESGYAESLHMEESCVAVYCSKYGRNNGEPVVMVIIAHGATPCGDCRDLLSSQFRDLEVITNEPGSSEAIVMSCRDYVHDVFRVADETTRCAIVGEMIETVRTGRNLENDAYPPKRDDESFKRKYYACVVTQRGRYYGALDTVCHYRPIYPIQDAVRQARRQHDPFVHSVIIVGEDCGDVFPNVMYGDRQYLAELIDMATAIDGESRNPTIYLATCAHRGETIDDVGLTTAREWLALPFSPRKLGEESFARFSAYHKSRMAT